MTHKFNDVLNFVNTNNVNDYTLLEIAEKLNMNEKTVRTHLKTLNIKKDIFTKDCRNKTNKVIELTNNGLTHSQIAKELKMTSRQLTTLRYSKQLKNDNKFNISLSDIEFQVIIGSLLGDGHIDDIGRLRIKHSCKQSDYLKYKKDLFNPEYISLFKDNVERFDKRTLKTYCNCSLDTICSQTLIDIRNRWYNKDRIKIICFEDFKKLDILGLSIWFMDDGFKENKGAGLATNCFSRDEISEMIILLKEKFNITFLIKKNYNVMYLKKDEYLKFEKLIKPYIIPLMQYKLQN